MPSWGPGGNSWLCMKRKEGGSQGDSGPWFAGSPASSLLPRLLVSVRASVGNWYLRGC